MKLKTKEGKQILAYVCICLPLTWLLDWIAYDGVFGGEQVRWAYGLQYISIFVPAMTAVFLCLITRESLWNLQFMPKLQENAKLYVLAILVGTTAVCLEILPTPLLFPEMASFHSQATADVVFYTVLAGISSACILFFENMGEELGWMGYLYPRMEKCFGMTGAIALSIVIRTGWHLVMAPWDGYLWYVMLISCMCHIGLVCMGVWLTKKSGSVVPVSVFHSIVNTMTVALNGCLVIDNTVYEAKRYIVELVQVVPYVLVGVVFFVLLKRNKKSA